MVIDDIEYVIFRHPDLAQIREFMDGPSYVGHRRRPQTRASITFPSNAATSTTSAWATWRWSTRATSIAGALAGISTAVRCLTIGPTRPGFHVEHFVDGDLVNCDTPTLDVRLAAKRCFSGARPFPGCELAVEPLVLHFLRNAMACDVRRRRAPSKMRPRFKRR